MTCTCCYDSDGRPEGHRINGFYIFADSPSNLATFRYASCNGLENGSGLVIDKVGSAICRCGIPVFTEDEFKCLKHLIRFTNDPKDLVIFLNLVWEEKQKVKP